MRRRRATGVLALVVGASAVMVPPAQAATWLPMVTASDEAGAVDEVDDLRLAIDVAGAATGIWVVEPDDPFAGDVLQTAVRAAGATDFGPVQAWGPGRNPDVVAHPDGSVTVAWEVDGRLWSTTRAAGALAFPTAGPVLGLPDGELKTPRLTVDAAGNVTMVFVRDDVLWYATRASDSAGWSVSDVPTSSGVGAFDVEAAPDGTVTLAWEETISLEEGGEVQHLEALTVSPEGTQVTTYVDYSQGALGHVALTDNASGVTALSWVRTGSSEVDLQVAVRAETDDLFLARDGLSGDEPVNEDVALVIDDAGRVSGAWAAADQGVIGVSRAPDGTVATTPLTVGDQYAPDVDAVVDTHGVVTLAWRQAAGSFFLATSRRPADGEFATPTTLTDVTDGRADDPMLGVAPSGDVTVAYSYYPEEDVPTNHVRSQVLDVNAPTLTATVPATGTPGAALDMSSGASDLWGPVSVAWSFGDGATATGASASHTYAAAGAYDVRVTATDGSGNATTRTRTVLVTQAGDRTPPVLSRARLVPDRLPTGHGARLRLTSSEAGRLVGVVDRRRGDGQWREVGTKRWSLQAGRSSKTFYGQAAQQRLASGKHRVRLVATDAAGNASRTVVLTFRVGPR